VWSVCVLYVHASQSDVLSLHIYLQCFAVSLMFHLTYLVSLLAHWMWLPVSGCNCPGIYSVGYTGPEITKSKVLEMCKMWIESRKCDMSSVVWHCKVQLTYTTVFQKYTVSKLKKTSSTLKTETAGSLKMLTPTYQIRWCHVPDTAAATLSYSPQK
jgi:hypothetical protein